MRLTTALAVILCLTAGSASAAVAVFGGGEAEHCFQAAEAGKSDDVAIRTCDIALATDNLLPEDRGGTLINRGIMRLRRLQFSEAKADLDAGVALNPSVGDGWLDRGAVRVALHQYSGGLADIDKAIALGVREPEKAYYNRAIAEEGVGDEKAAYFDYQHALALKPGWDLPQKELLRFTVTRR